jgi:hypothetical protein
LIKTPSLGRREKTLVFTYRGRHQSREREREGASSGQVAATPTIILRKQKKEEKAERKGILKVAFLLPDNACVRKLDRKGRKEKKKGRTKMNGARKRGDLSLVFNIR